jgi:GAF domain
MDSRVMSGPARNPWAAVDVTTDPVAHARALARAHERSLGGSAPVGVRELVVNSWQRSLAAGVVPDASGAPIVLSGEALEMARERSPLAPALDAIVGTLSGLDAEARHVLAISDADANLLWVTGNLAAVDLAREMRFQPGAAWSESAAGTNAVGTAVALDHPVQIFSAEHLVAAVHRWTCAGAPIHDPASGDLIGVVDLTAELRTAHPHTLSLAALAARAAEITLRLHRVEESGRLRERWEATIAGRRGASLLIDRTGRVIAARGVTDPPGRLAVPELPCDTVTSSDGRLWEAEQLSNGGAILWLRRRRAEVLPRLSLSLLGRHACARIGEREERALRSLELLAVLTMHPEGLTAQQLALALYGERGKTVTVRAQVHRVRAHLGEQLLSTQPYRLRASVDADWIKVQRLISNGRPAAALKAYVGPLLPASDAPEIRDTRGLIEESLRRSILTTADGELLARWLAHPSGADDHAAARALVAVLPVGDPRRAAATAASALLTRRMAQARG